MTQAIPDAIPVDALVECYRSDPRMTHQKWVRWACDCAERVLHVYEVEHPGDNRPRNAIEAARTWVANSTKENAADAADAAARAATYAADAADAAARAARAARAAADAADATYATYAAARAATYAADAADAAARAARAAARAATYAAAYAAAYAARAATYATRSAAERLWQSIRLMEIYHEGEVR